MSEPLRRLESVHVVRTPEYVEFEFPVAGLTSRFLAWLLDVAIASAGAGVVTAIIGALGVFTFAGGFAAAIIFVVWFLANWGYFVFFEIRMAGQTPGKKVLGLRVIQESGVRVGAYHALIRNLVRAVDHLPLFYLVGGAMALLSDRARRLGDIAAATVVVRDRRSRVPAGIAPPAEAMVQLRGDRRLEEKVKRASVEEREVFLSAALRREELATPARLSLFSSLAAYAADRFGLTKPEHLSDEKFVVALVGVMVGERK